MHFNTSFGFFLACSFTLFLVVALRIIIYIFYSLVYVMLKLYHFTWNVENLQLSLMLWLSCEYVLHIHEIIGPIGQCGNVCYKLFWIIIFRISCNAGLLEMNYLSFFLLYLKMVSFHVYSYINSECRIKFLF